jgi:hypothetical protein
MNMWAGSVYFAVQMTLKFAAVTLTACMAPTEWCTRRARR